MYVFSGSALAGVVPQYGGGGNHGGGGNNSGPNSELNIYQYGGGNSALALQTDARNSDLTITQHALVQFNGEVVTRIVKANIFHHLAQQVDVRRCFARFHPATDHLAQNAAEVFVTGV